MLTLHRLSQYLYHNCRQSLKDIQARHRHPRKRPSLFNSHPTVVFSNPACLPSPEPIQPSSLSPLPLLSPRHRHTTPHYLVLARVDLAVFALWLYPRMALSYSLLLPPPVLSLSCFRLPCSRVTACTATHFMQWRQSELCSW